MSILPTRRKASPTIEVEAVEAVFDGHAMLRTASPEYAALDDRFHQLCALEETLLAELAPLAAATRGTSREAEQMAAARAAANPPPARQHRPGALALLDGVTTPPPPEALEPKSNRGAVEQRCDELNVLIEDAREAIRLIRPQLEVAHRAATLVLVEQLAPEYRKVARNFVAALVGLGRAIEQHEAFIASVRTSGWSAFRPLVMSQAFGRPTEGGGDVRRLLAFAVEAGHVGRDELPSDWAVEP